MQVDHGVPRDAVEAQFSFGIVEENPDPVGEGFRRGGPEPPVVVARRVDALRALQTPGQLVVSQQAAGSGAVPGDAVVGDADVGAAAPLHLPVNGIQQPLPAQHLRASLKPVRVFRGPRVQPVPSCCSVSVS